jgi:hypothetical protein
MMPVRACVLQRGGHPADCGVAVGGLRLHTTPGSEVSVMLTSSWRRRLAIAAVAFATLIGTVGQPAAAADDPLFAPGVACTFGLDLEGVDNRKVHEFTDVHDNHVQLITGLAGPVTFTNAESGATLTLPARGTSWEIVTSLDGTASTFTATGHFVVIMFPTDDPAGPSTTLYVGRGVFTIDNTSGVWTLQETRGTATDLCAALSG